MKKTILLQKIVIITLLAGLVIWAIYDHKKSVNHDFNEKESKQNSDGIVEIGEKFNKNEMEVGLNEGNIAPDFQLINLEGKEMKLSDLQGKKVILNFWATWCPPCKEEIPDMQKFYEEHGEGNEQVEILAVNLTYSERNKADVEKFAKNYQMTFPILLDTNEEISDLYQVFTIPTSYLIDSKGIIRKKIIGPMDEKILNELMTKHPI